MILTLNKNQFQAICLGKVAKLSVTENIVGTKYGVTTTALVRLNREYWNACVLEETQPKKKETFKVEKKYLVGEIHSESELVFVWRLYKLAIASLPKELIIYFSDNY